MESNRKIKVGITHGDINGVGYEIILKAFSDPTMFDLCTPIVYGSPKAMTYHRKAMDIQTNYSIISNADDASDDTLYVINTCGEGEPKVNFAHPTEESGSFAVCALDRAIADFREGLIDVLVTAPVCASMIKVEGTNFTNQAAYVAYNLKSDGDSPLQIYLNDVMRVASVTENIPLSKVAGAISVENIMQKFEVFHKSLKSDFLISNPRIAILSLNPKSGEGAMGKEESEIIAPAIEQLRAKRYQCYGPYAADTFFGNGLYDHFDGVLAMYYDQGVTPLKALSLMGVVNYTAGVEAIHTQPEHGALLDDAGKGIADESALRNAVYSAIDILRNRESDAEASRNPLRKLYRGGRDDSDKLKLDQPTKEDE
ncbi:MAG: 4-hydroxythreonine-4-phosphate dehydrogenase PdxA [Bacteroidaceae bacterium]|nr:4-hydroxythreonine-4-phosphate dehydrogenase PdxA [Bacteroidaceae bacterium]